MVNAALSRQQLVLKLRLENHFWNASDLALDQVKSGVRFANEIIRNIELATRKANINAMLLNMLAAVGPQGLRGPAAAHHARDRHGQGPGAFQGVARGCAPCGCI